jgi:pimeloyl-ACP methyl ester carboxylesterase
MTKDEAMHPSTRTVRVGAADIHVTEWGAGPPVLMLHGNPDSGIMWEGIAERLAPRHRCIAPDLPGFGHSEVPAGFERSLDGLAEFIEQFLNAAVIGRPVDLVAHDFGGPFAFARDLGRQGPLYPVALRRPIQRPEGRASGASRPLGANRSAGGMRRRHCAIFLPSRVRP